MLTRRVRLKIVMPGEKKTMSLMTLYHFFYLFIIIAYFFMHIFYMDLSTLRPKVTDAVAVPLKALCGTANVIGKHQASLVRPVS